MASTFPDIWYVVATTAEIVGALQWRYNGREGVSNHQPHHCLLNLLFRRRSKKTSNPRHWPWWGKSPVTGEFPHKWPVTRKMFPFDDVIKKINPCIAKHVYDRWSTRSYTGCTCIYYTLKRVWVFSLTHLLLDKLASFRQAKFSDTFSWIKSFVFWSIFHWIMFLRAQLTINQHWFG